MTGIRRLTAALLAAVLLLSLAACQGDVSPPEESPSQPVMVSQLPVAEERELALGCAAAGSLHPLECTDRSDQDVCSLIYEGLYELDGSFRPQPLLAAEGQVSEDGKVWTFSLREGAAFSDGTPLEASHVVSSLKAAKKSALYAARLAEVSSVKAKDGRVVVTLTASNGALPALLDVPILLEREEGLPLGTGPYVLDGTEEERWLAANPNWWQGRIPLYDRIALHPTHQLDERVSAFDSGLVTAVTTDPTAANALGYSCEYETYEYPTTNLLFVGFNTQSEQCADPLVRRALSRALDRVSVAASLLEGHGTAASLPVSPYSEGYDSEGAALLDYDLEAARALLEEAGYTKNKDGLLARRRKVLTLRLVVSQNSLVKQEIARFLAEDLRKLGAEVTVLELGWDDYRTALENGEFELYLGEVKLTADFDISSLTFGELNYGGYWNEVVYGLLGAWKASGGDGRTEAGKALYAALAEDPPFAALGFKSESLLLWWGLAGKPEPVRGDPFRGIENWNTTDK